MPLFNPHELRSSLKPGQTVLGIDPGAKTIGLALSDVSLILASPLMSLKRRKLKENAGEIATLIRRENIGGLVAGLPLSMDGTFGPAARAASDWIADLSERLAVPACLWDERFSSSVVNRFLIQEADLSRKKRAHLVDQMAASYMLQGWLDATREPNVPSSEP